MNQSMKAWIHATGAPYPDPLFFNFGTGCMPLQDDSDHYRIGALVPVVSLATASRVVDP